MYVFWQLGVNDDSALASSSPTKFCTRDGRVGEDVVVDARARCHGDRKSPPRCGSRELDTIIAEIWCQGHTPRSPAMKSPKPARRDARWQSCPASSGRLCLRFFRLTNTDFQGWVQCEIGVAFSLKSARRSSR
jgi:hypothetical protein